MKNFLILCSIFILAYLVRFNNFSDRVVFWTEQAKSLETSLNYLQKPSLLGQEYFRQDSNSHIIYSGALFNYALLPIILFSHYDVVKITAFFAILNILTGLGVYLVVKKFFGQTTATYSSILFLFSNLMIYHSLFIWNYNLLPLIGLILFYLTFKNFKEYKSNNLFYLGLFCGLGISIQIVFIVYTSGVYLINVFRNKKAIVNTLMFSLGLTLGNLPMLLFDLRHNFYQTRTIWQFLLDTLNGNSDAGFAYYYLLPVFTLLVIFFGWLLSKLNIYLASIILVLYLFLNYNYPIINKGMTVSEIDIVAKLISLDAKDGFNIASDIDFDKRAYAIRYLLKYKYEKPVMGVEDYKTARLMYVLATKDYNFKDSGTWEIKAGGSYKVTELQNINNKYTLYKLTK